MFDNLYQKTITGLILCSVACCFAFSSCDDFLDVESERVAKEDQQWVTLEDTRAALMGVYGLVRAALAENNTHWICGDLRAGDFTVTSRKDLQSVVDNDLKKPYPLLKEISNWRRFYAAINAASLFIEKAPRTFEKDRSYSEQNLRYDIAQARVLRAFTYFYMVRIWGDVPLITYSYDNGSFPEIARTDAEVVLSFVKNELKSAIKMLPFELGTSSNLYYGRQGSDWRGILLNKLSAYAILAHVSAWEGNYADVETYTTYIMDNATRINARYVSVADLTSTGGIFSTYSDWRSSRLVSFVFPFRDSESTQCGHLEQLTLAAPMVQKSIPDMYISNNLLHSIFNEVDDQRYGIDPKSGKYYTNYINNTESQYPVFSKVKVIQDGEPRNNDYAVFGSVILFSRLEDIVLLRAEALCANNRPEEALEHLNTIREARGLKVVSYRKDFENNKERVIQAVFNERRRELMGEGWRWYDLIREQKLLKKDPALEELIIKGGIYWPVDEDIFINSLISQNSYWQ
jgi:hypothetical protein